MYCRNIFSLFLPHVLCFFQFFSFYFSLFSIYSFFVIFYFFQLFFNISSSLLNLYICSYSDFFLSRIILLDWLFSRFFFILLSFSLASQFIFEVTHLLCFIYILLFIFSLSCSAKLTSSCTMLFLSVVFIHTYFSNSILVSCNHDHFHCIIDGILSFLNSA